MTCAVALLLRDIQSGRLSARATQQQQQQQQQQLGGAAVADSRSDSGADASSQAAGRGVVDSHDDSRHSAASQLAELRSVTQCQLLTRKRIIISVAHRWLAPIWLLILFGCTAGRGSV